MYPGIQVGCIPGNHCEPDKLASETSDYRTAKSWRDSNPSAGMDARDVFSDNNHERVGVSDTPDPRIFEASQKTCSTEEMRKEENKMSHKSAAGLD